MANKKKKDVGLKKASEETKKRVSDAGHEAQGDKTTPAEEVVMEWEEEDYMVIPDRRQDANLGPTEEDSFTTADESRGRSNDQSEEE